MQAYHFFGFPCFALLTILFARCSLTTCIVDIVIINTREERIARMTPLQLSQTFGRCQGPNIPGEDNPC